MCLDTLALLENDWDLVILTCLSSLFSFHDLLTGPQAFPSYPALQT
jgi:hypothetical protein